MRKREEKTAPETKEQEQKTVEAAEEAVQENPPDSPAEEAVEQEQDQTDTAAPDTPVSSTEDTAAKLADVQDRFLRLAAEYDNFRRRTQKEKEAIYANAKVDAVKPLLPVYDNLERALKQETTDEAYKKGVEMTMDGLKKAFCDLGITEIAAEGQPFDPKLHNAVMHVEDEALEKNTVAEVFQTGFQLGEKVIRFAMVKVAN